MNKRLKGSSTLARSAIANHEQTRPGAYFVASYHIDTRNSRVPELPEFPFTSTPIFDRGMAIEHAQQMLQIAHMICAPSRPITHITQIDRGGLLIMSGYAQERHNAHGALKYMLMVSYRDLEDELWPLSCLYLRPAEE